MLVGWYQASISCCNSTPSGLFTMLMFPRAGTSSVAAAPSAMSNVTMGKYHFSNEMNFSRSDR